LELSSGVIDGIYIIRVHHAGMDVPELVGWGWVCWLQTTNATQVGLPTRHKLSRQSTTNMFITSRCQDYLSYYLFVCGLFVALQVA
jgi:hypothetical protein